MTNRTYCPQCHEEKANARLRCDYCGYLPNLASTADRAASLWGYPRESVAPCWHGGSCDGTCTVPHPGHFPESVPNTPGELAAAFSGDFS